MWLQGPAELQSILAGLMKPHTDTNDWPRRFSSQRGIRGPGQKQVRSYRPQKHKLRASSRASETRKHTQLKGQEMFYLNIFMVVWLRKTLDFYWAVPYSALFFSSVEWESDSTFFVWINWIRWDRRLLKKKKISLTCCEIFLLVFLLRDWDTSPKMSLLIVSKAKMQKHCEHKICF